MDVLDVAQEREELHRENALRAHRERREVALVNRPGAFACQECGEPIPSARLRALPQAIRCLPCQEREERRRA